MKMNKYFFLGVFLITLCASGLVWAQSLPRFVSLKSNEINMRTGPGERFPIDWIYQEKNYPVEIIDEFEFWRQIREYDGTTGWVHRIMLSSARYALILQDCKIYAKPNTTAQVVGLIQKNALGRIVRCPKQSDFCLVDFQTVKGWLKKEYFWGIYPNEVID